MLESLFYKVAGPKVEVTNTSGGCFWIANRGFKKYLVCGLKSIWWMDQNYEIFSSKDQSLTFYFSEDLWIDLFL